ncbi:MAG TPA: thymidylate kinase [Dehalococcoidia bacterium]|nr:thymidylate kinase [Dehalococcoidia bacterium]
MLRQPQPGCLIVLEGLDGSGKTTQARLLTERLASAGRRVLLTAEPTRGPIGRLIREVIATRPTSPPRPPHRTFRFSAAERGHDAPALSHQGAGLVRQEPPFDPFALALLFAADRRDHLAHEIEPALRRGDWVVCDRYLLSSLAYQSETSPRHPPLAWVAAINGFARPADLTLYLRLSVPECLARLAGRSGQADAFETAPELRRIARGYRTGLAHLKEAGWDITSIDGRGDIDRVAERIWSAVGQRLI